MALNKVQAAIIENGDITAHGFLSDLFPDVGSWPKGGVPSESWMVARNVKLIRFKPAAAEFDPETQNWQSSELPYLTGEGEVVKFSVADIPVLDRLDALMEARVGELANIRARYETSGIDVNGVFVRTDIDHQVRLSTARQAVSDNPEMVIDWRLVDGSWVSLGASDVESMFSAVSAHVQACFSNEKSLSQALITAADTTSKTAGQALIDVAAVDLETGWPAVSP